MRYFVIMDDGVIKPANNVTKQKSTGRVYFDVDGKMYRHLTFTYDCEHYICKRIRLPIHSFQQFVHEEWVDVRQIRYLIALDEEEDEELNYFESTDFNAGMIYGRIDKAMGPAIIDVRCSIKEGHVVIPKIQAIPKLMLPGVTEEDIINATCKSVIAHFDAVYGKQFTLSFTECKQENRYIMFNYIINRKDDYKEMTIEQIEKELGYKIKVVGEG